MVSPYQACRLRSKRSISSPAASTSGCSSLGTAPEACSLLSQPRSDSMSPLAPEMSRITVAKVAGVMYDGVHRSDRTPSTQPMRPPFLAGTVTWPTAVMVDALLRDLLSPLTNGWFQNCSTAALSPRRALMVLNRSLPRRFSSREIASLIPEHRVLNTKYMNTRPRATSIAAEVLMAAAPPPRPGAGGPP